ncbi:hypothetical protein [Vibrio cincinnatiensis]|uniref:hypothetical protein n=1 Tax=Vibrio cincinnatiensis TaxID=675 RepID=UPI001EE0EC93|nr:hypothetical protein [Vibrio cincinnatiensis]MCG3726325.1 hypothetical protein [Vibrio cincinnatiensis]
MWSTLGIKLKNNSNIADVMSGSILTVKAGDALLVSNSLLEIVEVHANQLILRTKWEQADDELTCSVIPTFGDFNQAVREIRLLRENTANNISALEAWGTQTGTVVFKGEDGEEHTARTLQQMDADASAIFASLGTAATRNVMTHTTDMETPNALMPRGAFGLGIINPTVLDIPTHFGYTYNSNNPAAVLGMAGPFISHSFGQRGFILAARGFRAAIKTFGESNNPTLELYHNYNAVGTVSQSGRVPTGGLMDWGETPNGQFYRYANGLQICVKRGGRYTVQSDAGVEWIFPAQFSSQDRIATAEYRAGNSASESVAVITPTVYTSGTTSQSFFVMRLNGSKWPTGEITLDMLAIGRWY